MPRQNRMDPGKGNASIYHILDEDNAEDDTSEGVLMGVECWLMCVVRRMFGAQACSVVRRLFGCGLVVLLVILIVQGDAGPLLLSPWNAEVGVSGADNEQHVASYEDSAASEGPEFGIAFKEVRNKVNDDFDASKVTRDMLPFQRHHGTDTEREPMHAEGEPIPYM